MLSLCSELVFFYRATLCVSAVLPSAGVCLSVRHTIVYCIVTAKDIIFSPGYIPIILTFSAQAPLHNFKRNPLSGGGVKWGFGGKIRNFG